LVDSVVANSATTAKSGYVFAAAPVAGPAFAAFNSGATPSVHTTGNPVTGTGSRSFYTNESGIMYYNTTATASTCTADDARTVTAGTGGGILN
jgi:hypothetical protein